MEKIVVFLDLETGGLDPAQHSIIQIACVAMLLPAYEVLGQFNEKVKFDIAKQDPEALKNNVFGRNGYTIEKWNGEAKHPVIVAGLLRHWLEPYKDRQEIGRAGKPYLSVQLAGHNITAFDLPFISKWIKRLEESENAKGNSFNSYFGFNWQPLDTLAIAAFYRFTMPGYDPENLKLETLCRYHGIAKEQTHDALDDLHLNVDLFRCLQFKFSFDNEISQAAPVAGEAIQRIFEGLPDEIATATTYKD